MCVFMVEFHHFGRNVVKYNEQYKKMISSSVDAHIGAGSSSVHGTAQDPCATVAASSYYCCCRALYVLSV